MVNNGQTFFFFSVTVINLSYALSKYLWIVTEGVIPKYRDFACSKRQFKAFGRLNADSKTAFFELLVRAALIYEREYLSLAEKTMKGGIPDIDKCFEESIAHVGHILDGMDGDS